MGKIFVKGPTESPDDLIAKNRLRDFGMESLRSAGQIADNQINTFGGLMGALGRPLAHLFRRKPLSPQQQADLDARIRHNAREKIKLEMQPAIDAQRALEARQKQEADNQALLSRFQNLTQRRGAETAGLTPYRGVQDLAEFEDYARQKFPGMSLNDVATMLGRQFTNVEAEDLRSRLRGKAGIEGYGAQQTADELEAASDAAEPISLEETAAMVDPAYFVPVPDTKAIADSGALSDDQNDGKNEIQRVETMANEQNKNLGMNTVNEAIQKPKEPDFGAAPPLPTDPTDNQESNLGLTPDQRADIEDERRQTF
jgi:hypothetical protein|tara:strand:+ start:321 stop:1259 length:939 start_codon:yes stop_codon:yes gene_type:complete